MPLALRILLVAATLAGCASCADPPPSEYPSQQVYSEDTTLGPGDVFEVRVFQQEQMTQIYSASAEGTISFPLIGEVVVDGKSPAQIETEIRERLADGYLKDPQVSVLVKEYKSKKISVFGQVRKPGTLSFTDGMTVVEAISQAGGFTPMARENAVTITRGTAEDKQTYTVPVESIGKGKAQQFYIRPGDVIFVPHRRW
ncbi:MAG: polysaccharide export protein [Kofleriaceae bacterium]|nr:MAG: polysaccharide export protein [Kofleriaceae bacterium]